MNDTITINTSTNDPIHSLPAQVGPSVAANTRKEIQMPERTLTPAVTCSHPAWCDDASRHAPTDQGVWHSRQLGIIPVLANDLIDEDPRPDAPLVLEVSATDPEPTTHAVLAIEGWAEVVELDLDGIRKARDLFAEAARLMGDDDGFAAAAAEACALVGGAR
ncbi:hypothetical protein [Amycolatopsis viridis]|uniref:Uncharacterized protein n=1 Tax=Amycolatopsis viridis TaxID=185678 RepID=A0ABX0SXK1_9PSEU|nr:hypothetical protein [Amycolatopsis viridis]NIH81707.1 hypothetical protein [Amycolatopsis viridis]